MTDLAPTTALGAATARTLRVGGFDLTENDGLALASLALRRGADRPRPFGLALPEPGRLTAGDGAGALWLGPDRWMIEAAGRAETDFASAVAAEAPGARVTEQTDGWVAFGIAGAGIDQLLERLVNLPPEAVGPGCATRTVLHHMAVLVLRRGPNRLSVLGPRSSAGSLLHALEQAMRHLETTG